MRDMLTEEQKKIILNFRSYEKKKKSDITPNKLDDHIREADALGMSYGKYMVERYKKGL